MISIHVHLFFDKKTKIKIPSHSRLCSCLFHTITAMFLGRLLHSIQGKWKPKLKLKLWYIFAVTANYNKWQRLLIEKFIVLKHYRDAKRIKLKAGCSGVQSFSPSSCWWWRWSSCSGPPVLHYTVPLAGLEVPLYSFTGWSWSPPSYVR